MRAIYTRMMLDEPVQSDDRFAADIISLAPDAVHADFGRPTARVLDEVEQLIRTHHGTSDGRIEVWPAPAHPNMATADLIRATPNLARQFHISWTIHLSDHDVHLLPPDIKSITGRLHGLIDGRLLACHCVGLGDADVELLETVGARATTQPVANGYLAMGGTPLPILLSETMAVGIGTDDLNCNETADLLADMKAPPSSPGPESATQEPSRRNGSSRWRRSTGTRHRCRLLDRLAGTRLARRLHPHQPPSSAHQPGGAPPDHDRLRHPRQRAAPSSSTARSSCEPVLSASFRRLLNPTPVFAAATGPGSSTVEQGSRPTAPGRRVTS